MATNYFSAAGTSSAAFIGYTQVWEIWTVFPSISSLVLQTRHFALPRSLIIAFSLLLSKSVLHLENFVDLF